MNLLTVKKYLFNQSLTKFQEIQLKYINSILHDILVPILCNYNNIDIIKSQITDIESFYFGFKQNPSLISEKLALPLYIYQTDSLLPLLVLDSAQYMKILLSLF